MAWASILDRLEAEPEAPGIRLEAGLHGPAEDLSRRRLLYLAGLAANTFRAAGFGPGDRIVTLLPTGRPLLQAIFGAWHAGGAICVVAPSIETGRSSLAVERLRTMLGIVRPRVILALAPEFEPIAEAAAALGAQLLSPADLLSEGPSAQERARSRPDDMAFIQFTSGSTGLPKAIVIEHRQLIENCQLLAKAQCASSDATVVSWLPIHHDMGFVDGVMMPLSISARLVLLPTETYIRDPTRWLRLISTSRATHSVGPPSAYQLLTKPIYARRLEGVDLSTLRCSVIGAEPVSWNVVRDFEETYVHHGLRPGALCPGYGMAEATLVISGRGPAMSRRLVWIEKELLQREGAVRLVAPRAAGSVALVSNGPLFDGFSLSVRDERGSTLLDGKQGRLYVSGPCVTRRYFGSDEDPQPGGWLDTGDLGFVLDGEVYITGRAKDVIIRGGVNVHAHQIEESALQGMPELAQRAVAFSVPRDSDLRDEIVLGIELRVPSPPADFAAQARRVVARDVGLQIDHVLPLPKGTIPRTTSGKIQRSLARDLFLAGKLVASGHEGATS